MIDKVKLINEIDKLLNECEEKQEKETVDTDRWYRAGGQISVLNNLKNKISNGVFDVTQ